MSEIEKKVHDLRIFAGISEEVIKELLSNAPIEVFTLWETILEEGALSNGKWYIIKSGEVLVSRAGEEISRLGHSDMFGEIALLNEEQRTATVEALSDVETIVMTQADILAMLNNDDSNINKEIIRRMESNLSDM